MSEHDIVVSKLDEILSILKTEQNSNNTSNTSPDTSANTVANNTSNVVSNTVITSNVTIITNFDDAVEEVQQLLRGSVGSIISSFGITRHNVNGKRKVTIDIKEK